MDSFRIELQQLINKHNIENGSDTPDFILTQFLLGCLYAFDSAVIKRQNWYNKETNITEVPVVDTVPEREPNSDAKAFMALGWMVSECCVMHDRGLDPNKMDIAELLDRAATQLGLKK